MIFIYKKWEAFCKRLQENEITSITIADCFKRGNQRFLVLKHDVETNVNKAYELAKIENKYGHKGTYYVQAYLLDNVRNIGVLKKMQEMGHEISYHYDVMDSNKGNIEKAIEEFKSNITRFEENGFQIRTLCQHGNPLVERMGYTSNRDFFRAEKVQQLYGEMCDVMVDLKLKANIEYDYYSDAGRKFKLIFDPITNDIVNSDNKNVPYSNLDMLYEAILNTKNNAIISIHPHRWSSSIVIYFTKAMIFKCAKTVVKVLILIPIFRKLMGRFYYIAKKM